MCTMPDLMNLQVHRCQNIDIEIDIDNHLPSIVLRLCQFQKLHDEAERLERENAQLQVCIPSLMTVIVIVNI